MLRFARRDNPYSLAVGMTGVKLGDRLLQVGCADGGRFAALASKVGLSGLAVALVPDEAAATRARKGAAAGGVLVDVKVGRPSTLPVDDGAFDVVVVDDTNGLLGSLADADRSEAVREVFRALRPGGRTMIFGAGAARGLSALLGRAPSGSAYDPIPALEAGGFRPVRRLAEREGLTFVEGVKPRT